MDPKEAAGLKRPVQPMPATIRQALETAGLMETYKARPAYQQNDYLGWIARARLAATKEKRLSQMLEELRQGNVYMKMKWDPVTSRKR
ncbi:YdeI/OmpD-associated family protein [Taibaiella koreensis]|uniref:YdeI/OmpD-associated family protein n=1 Tax=Taibaiella koreensis TaxID=1268548 RepID=UPI000E59EFD0|nr:YdeI/OmpD-associated family protein [Taibaiella koreensis]